MLGHAHGLSLDGRDVDRPDRPLVVGAGPPPAAETFRAGEPLGLQEQLAEGGVGDVILEAGGHPVSQPSDVTSVLNDAKKDGRKAVLLRVKSGDNTHFVAVTTNQKS